MYRLNLDICAFGDFFNCFGFVNKEVVDTAALIMSNAYKEPAYRDESLEVARELLRNTKRFLEKNK